MKRETDPRRQILWFALRPFPSPVLVEAITELVERYWITLVWKPAPPGLADDAPRPHTDIDRLVTTRHGRRKYRGSRPQA